MRISAVPHTVPHTEPMPCSWVVGDSLLIKKVVWRGLESKLGQDLECTKARGVSFGASFGTTHAETVLL